MIDGGYERQIRHILEESSSLIAQVARDQSSVIAEATEMLVTCFQTEGKVLLFGNGGSASDALHIQGELMNRFFIDRKGLPCFALVAGAALVTAISNDYAYEELFSRQVEAIGRPGDVAIGLSTSGTSKNVLAGIRAANGQGMKTIAMTGESKTEMTDAADLSIRIPSTCTPRIQEAHIAVAHVLCELVEARIFGPKSEAVERM